MKRLCDSALTIIVCLATAAWTAGCGSATAPTRIPDVSGVWTGPSELTDIVGGECAGDTLRARTDQRTGRRMTVIQNNRQLTVSLAIRGLLAGDETWAGSIDEDGRITLTWQPSSASSRVLYVCTDAARNVRYVTQVSASALLTLSRDGSRIEGTVGSQSDVTTVSGQYVERLSQTTRESLTKGEGGLAFR